MKKMIWMPLLALFSACGQDEVLQKPQSPSGAVREFYADLGSRNYEEAKRHLSKEALEHLNSEVVVFMGGANALFEQTTKDGKLQRVEPIREVLQDEQNAVVRLKCYYTGGEVSEVKHLLVKEKNEWKIKLR